MRHVRMLIWVKVIVFGFGLCFVSSCGTPGGMIADRSKIELDSPDASMVTVMRKKQFAGSFIKAQVALDTEPIAYIGSGDRVEFEVMPGEHFVAVLFQNGMDVEMEDVVQFEAKPKQKYYFFYSTPLMGEGRFKLEELTPEDGKKELSRKKYKLIGGEK